MAAKRPLARELQRRFPDISPAEAVSLGIVLVNGVVATNPNALVDPGSSISLRTDKPLRGRVKLAGALRDFGVDGEKRVALDAGAGAGGFVQALLERGVARVYAVDVGYGQLLGSIRQDPRVVVLERTNIGELGPELVPEPVDLITLDLGYLALAVAVPQLTRIGMAPGAELVALVKPMSELGMGELPHDPELLDQAVERARSAIERAGWRILGVKRSGILGSRGAVEFFIHARRAPSAAAERVG